MPGLQQRILQIECKGRFFVEVGNEYSEIAGERGNYLHAQSVGRVWASRPYTCESDSPGKWEEVIIDRYLFRGRMVAVYLKTIWHEGKRLHSRHSILRNMQGDI